MEGLGVAANIIAVVEISAKVATLCVQYSTAVASARADIARLQTQVSQLGAVLQAAKRLTEGPKGQSLSVSQELTESLRECIAELQRLDEKLAPSTARKAMRRVGLRALKWPFTSKETRDIVDNLERYEKAISLGLQIDQTFLLLDIQEGIKDLQLNSVTTSSDARKTHFVIPFPRDPHCVDRPPIWSWLKEQYASTATRIALVGMGGFGKSQMAIRFAHDVHAESPDTSVFWVHASTKETFKESYQSIADILALPDRHNPSVNVLALVRDWLQRENLGPWLMIVDNADDVEMLFMANKSSDNTEIPIASYLPKTGNGKILVTSRSWDAAEKLTGSGREILRVQTMEEAQALQLFRNKLGQDVDEPSTLELIHRLDCIPLAVSQAAAYIFKRGPRVTVRSYLDDFQKSERRKGTLLRSDRGDLRRYEGMSNSVMVTWQMTFEQIRRERPRAAKLLSLMSCFHAQNIPEYMLHDYAANYADPDEANGDQGKGGDDDDDDDQFQNDMEVLQSYSLVTPTVVPGFSEMHSLVHFCTRVWISTFGDPRQWNHHFLRLASQHFPSGDFETWDQCQVLLPHVQLLLNEEPSEEKARLDWSQLLMNMSWYMIQKEEYPQAEGLARSALRIQTTILGKCHPMTVKSMRRMTGACGAQGRWEEAEKLLVELIEHLEANLGTEHPDTLACMTNLGWVYLNMDRLEEAEKLGLSVMKTLNTKPGRPGHTVMMMACMANLAATYANQGRLEEAEKLGQEALEACETKLGSGHFDTMKSKADLAAAYNQQGRWEEAEKLGLETLEFFETLRDGNDNAKAECMGNLAITWYGLGRHREACAMMQRCILLMQNRHQQGAVAWAVECLEAWQAEAHQKDSGNTTQN